MSIAGRQNKPFDEQNLSKPSSPRTRELTVFYFSREFSMQPPPAATTGLSAVVRVEVDVQLL